MPLKYDNTRADSEGGGGGGARGLDTPGKPQVL